MHEGTPLLPLKPEAASRVCTEVLRAGATQTGRPAWSPEILLFPELRTCNREASTQE